MANVDTVFQLLKFRASKSGYTGAISSNDFNLVFPKAEVRYYNKLFGNQNEYRIGMPIPPIAYPGTLKVSTSLAKFNSPPIQIVIDASGRYTKPADMFYVDSLSHYVTGTGGSSISTFTLAGGSGYTNGVYPITFTGGASGIATVAGGVVTSFQLNYIGTGYTVSQVLTETIPVGTGWQITVTALTQDEPTPIKRVEKQDLADNLYSYYEFPTEIFPIYVEFPTYIQFYPATLGTAQLIYLKAPPVTFWNYTLNGGVGLTNTLVGGSTYTDGIYPNVNFTGGAGNSAMGTITVSGGVVTEVDITNQGFGYLVGDTLTGALPVGSGWSFKVASILNARQVYQPTGSIDPIWSDVDIDEVIYLALADMGIFLRDSDTSQFAAANMKTGGTT